VAVDHIGEAFVVSEVRHEAGSLVVKEAPRPALLPELVEGLLEDIGGVEALVGGQQNLAGALASRARFSRRDSRLLCTQFLHAAHNPAGHGRGRFESVPEPPQRFLLNDRRHWQRFPAAALREYGEANKVPTRQGQE
jgi:hypothetical protein